MKDIREIRAQIDAIIDGCRGRGGFVCMAHDSPCMEEVMAFLRKKNKQGAITFNESLRLRKEAIGYGKRSGIAHFDAVPVSYDNLGFLPNEA